AGFWRSGVEPVCMAKSRFVLFACATAGILTSGIIPARAALQSGTPQTPVPFDASPAARDTEPVVLTGASFPTWTAPSDQSAKVPATGGAQCQGIGQSCSHNQYDKPEVSTGDAIGAGAPTNKLLAYARNPHAR